MENFTKELLSGNEAVARGAYEAGIDFACGYPGTPSTEILETIAAKFKDIKAQWSVNEKTALETAVGAAFCGARCVVTMKHVGLNVALDPLMTLSYLGIKGGLILAVADDPGQHSSQDEQDTRHIARLAKIPVFEPSDSQEAKDFVKIAIETSEKFDTPVILRMTTRISHSKGLVHISEKINRTPVIKFERNPQKFVPVPIFGRKMRIKVEKRVNDLMEYASSLDINKYEIKTDEFGIITNSIAYQYAAETFPEASILKLGMCYPFPDKLIKEFCGKVKNILIIEELEDIIEEHTKSLGIQNVYGKRFVPICGELDLNIMENVKYNFYKEILNKEYIKKETSQKQSAQPLPVRAPVLCSGCPHTGVFYALKKERKGDDLIVNGDIGCYSLAVFPPLDIMDTILCMGGGFTMALGMKRAGAEQRIVGVLGDSTFFHSGITGMVDAAYNKCNITLIVLDNRITAMTGHQENPGTGKDIYGLPAPTASIEALAKAAGIKRVIKINPLNLKETREAIKEELNADEPSVIIAESPCKFINKGYEIKPYIIDQDACKGCSLCLQLGCPALEKPAAKEGEKAKVRINSTLCYGCGLCSQVCNFNAISKDNA